MTAFGGFYRDKTVLVTGHTGFKGSWLSIWLTSLGARVVGYALEPPTSPSNFEVSGLEGRVIHVNADVRDFTSLERTIHEHRPDIVFHLAAQSLVRLSFAEPRRTFEVNLMGTVNVLEAARRVPSVQAVVAITSDKCYRNHNWPWGYRETDELGGFEPYSASKGCAELAISCYQDGRFQGGATPTSDLAIASTRAGNVIGGGDWAADRLVPDVVRALASGTDLLVRNPEATRPWQHVLEPLSGYLWLGARVAADRRFSTSWNFGPDDRPLTVGEIAGGLLRRWQPSSTRIVVEHDTIARESQLLRLDCSKAQRLLDWRPTWTIEEALNAIVAWYRRYYDEPGADLHATTVDQIARYTADARARHLAWANTP